MMSRMCLVLQKLHKLAGSDSPSDSFGEFEQRKGKAVHKLKHIDSWRPYTKSGATTAADKQEKKIIRGAPMQWRSYTYSKVVIRTSQIKILYRVYRNLKMEYIDLYLIHWPMSSKPGIYEYPIKKENFLPMDFKSVWAAMEDCQKLGLTKSIGVSNFSCKKLAHVLEIAKIPPAVNQVEVSPCWQQKNLREFCKNKGILVVGYGSLGSIGTFYGTNRVIESEILKEIANAKGKTVAQIALRWCYEQGIGVVVKSYNTERMKQNLAIFDWSLNDEECRKISEIPQGRACLGKDYTSPYGPYKTIEELWDEEL